MDDSDSDDEGPEICEDEEAKQRKMRKSVWQFWCRKVSRYVSDAAIKVLLIFFSTFLTLFLFPTLCTFLCTFLARQFKFVTTLPRAARAARGYMLLVAVESRDDFQKFACCPKCYNVYPQEMFTHKKNVS